MPICLAVLAQLYLEHKQRDFFKLKVHPDAAAALLNIVLTLSTEGFRVGEGIHGKNKAKLLKEVKHRMNIRDPRCTNLFV